MKKRLLSTALLCVLSIGVLAGCDNEDEDVTGGDDVEYSISITNKSELQESWSVGDSSRSISVALSPEGNPTQEVTTGALTVTSSDSTVVAATGLSLSAQGLGEATITVNWHNATDSVALTVSEASYESIASINTGIEAGTIKDGDTVRFYGRFVGGMEPSTTHLYSGVYLADGEDSLMLYAGNITNVFFEDGEQVINFGDDLAVTATVSTYSGFYEFKPTDVVVLTEAQSLEYGITDPEIITITEDNLESFTCYDVGQLAQATVTYESHSADSSGHVTITTTLGETPLTVYVNYHNGTEQMALINEALLGMSAGTELTVCGVIGWHSGLQLCPNFIYVDGEIVTPSEGFIVGTQTAPETITIVAASGVTSPASLKAGETLQLSISVGRGENASVTWESSDEDVASISASGLVTAGEKEGTATITATSKAATGVTDTFEVIVVSSSGPVVVEELDDGGYYKLGYRNEHFEKYFVSEEGAAVHSYEDGAAVLYEVVEGGVTLKIGDKYVTNSEGSLALSETAETLTYTEGVFKSGDLTLGVSGETLGFYSEPDDTLVLWDYAIDPVLGTAEGLVEGTYYIGMFKGSDTSTIYYDTGVINNGFTTGSGTTSTDANEAALYTVAYVTDLGYTIQDASGRYIYAAPSSSTYTTGYFYIGYDSTTAHYWNWDEAVGGLYTVEANQNSVDLTLYLGMNSSGYYESYTSDQTFNCAQLYIPNTETVSLIGMKLEASRESIYVGSQLALTVTYYPTCITTAPGDISWTSSNESAATVEDGVVTGVAANSDPVTITATIDSISASTSIYVLSGTEYSIEITPESLAAEYSMTIGNSSSAGDVSGNTSTYGDGALTVYWGKVSGNGNSICPWASTNTTNNKTTIRIYSGAYFTVTSGNGTLSRVVIDAAAGSSNTSNLCGTSFSVGEGEGAVGAATSTTDGDQVEITALGTSMTITRSGSVCYCSGITIYYIA